MMGAWTLVNFIMGGVSPCVVFWIFSWRMVDSRRQRGEYEEDQFGRLSPFPHRRDISGQPGSYSAIHKLAGLEQCIKEHEITIDELDKNKPVVTHRDWLIRPLREPYLRYSSRDVHLIGILYAHFKEQGYINNDRLPSQSARYVSLLQGAKPRATDIFNQHPLLPLHILEYNGYALTRSCISCKRSLPETAFSKSGWKQAKKRECWVCRAISVRRKMHDNWEREEGGDWDGDFEDDDGW
ncbi:hypothetical protein M413DRAFT_408566 [Hebeloma cylindrosporum]|uniref:Uncharacterized protein n=1 Tax=Hebeloma cylindrosporum TaxID=76867 RepID=A0A0C3C1B1_HEBCY|nr:hypothetical protein M413DRAFT_408566 [Hebeloma cylindrosporum h7]